MRARPGTVECVVNVSEGRDAALLQELSRAAGRPLLDVHTDGDHHRTVFTLGGPLDEVEHATRALAETAVARIDLGDHEGVHPRIGAVDVVPFVALGDDDRDRRAVLDARDRTAAWLAGTLGVPVFLYGPERTLPEVRRGAFTTLLPDAGPVVPHPTAGATAVGVRPVLVAYNVWLTGTGDDAGSGSVLEVARAVAAAVRSPTVRALGMAVTGGAQVSCNLLAPGPTTVSDLVDEVTRLAAPLGGVVVRGELVGLAPAAVIAGTPAGRRDFLGVDDSRSIEARLEASAAP